MLHELELILVGYALSRWLDLLLDELRQRQNRRRK